MSERDLIERLAIRAARFEASPGNDLIYGQGEAQTDKEAAATIARLSEALAEAEKKGADDWQPIETAPKQGQILAWWPSIRRGKHMGAVLQTTWTGTRWWRPTIHEDADAPTHWRPLPAPPRDLSQGGQHG